MQVSNNKKGEWSREIHPCYSFIENQKFPSPSLIKAKIQKSNHKFEELFSKKKKKKEKKIIELKEIISFKIIRSNIHRHNQHGTTELAFLEPI